MSQEALRLKEQEAKLRQLEQPAKSLSTAELHKVFIEVSRREVLAEKLKSKIDATMHLIEDAESEDLFLKIGSKTSTAVFEKDSFVRPLLDIFLKELESKQKSYVATTNAMLEKVLTTDNARTGYEIFKMTL